MTSERERFEAFMYPGPVKPGRWDGGKYKSSTVESQWEGWQARAALPAPADQATSQEPHGSSGSLSESGVEARTQDAASESDSLLEKPRLLPGHKDNFNGEQFIRDLERCMSIRKTKANEVGEATGVSTTSLSRILKGTRRPDAASLAALCSWMGANPTKYVAPIPKRTAPSLEMLHTLLAAALNLVSELNSTENSEPNADAAMVSAQHGASDHSEHDQPKG